MLKLRSLTGLLVVLFWTSQLGAQQYSFINYNNDDGLPQSQVRSITQDSLGYLWIATLGGVSRFDGYTFENFSVLDGLLGNQVYSLSVDKDGMVWMGLVGGISVFDGNSISSFRFDESEQLQVAVKLIADQDTLWIVTDRGKLFKFYNNSFYNLSMDKNIDDLSIQSVIRTAKGELLIASKSGVYILENNLLKTYRPPELEIYTKDIIEVDSVLWFGSRWNGLFKEERDSIAHHYYKGIRINDIVSRGKGEIWIASGTGISKWNGVNFINFNRDNGLFFDNVRCLFVDRENVLWIGTNGGGLFKFSGGLITTMTIADGMNSNLVMSIVEDDKKDLIVGTYDKGLNVLLKDTIYFIEEEQGLISNRIWSMESQNGGILWIASSGGLSKITDKEIINYNISDGLINNKTTSLYMDNDLNELWVGSLDGYVLLKDGRFIAFNGENGFPGKRVRKIQKDNQGHVWFGCINGLIEFDGLSYKIYTIIDGLPSNSVYCLEFDGDRTWIGTKLGLAVLENGKISHIQLGKSMGDFQISFLLNDKRGRVWAGTSNGIYTIQTNNNGTFEIDHYTKENGLDGLESNMNAVYLDTVGNVFAGLESGLVRFDRKVLDNFVLDKLSKPVIKDLKLYLKDIDWKNYSDSLTPLTSLPANLHLQPEDNYLTFEFTAFNFGDQSKVQYQFKLLGAEGKLSNEWSAPSYNNFATFSNLSSGDYTFKVQATTQPGIWSDDSADYSFTIITPYYATWWFRSLMVLMIGGIISLIIYWRYSIIRQKRENKRLMDQSKMLALEQQTLNANMNRHFVFNSLNSIQYYLNKEDKYNANLYLSRFAKLIRKNLDSSQSTFTSLHEEIERMSLYLELEQMRFKERFSYNFKIDNNIDVIQTKIPAMLFQPYLENSIWHGILPMKTKGNIEITVLLNENKNIEIEIIDDGIGIRTSLGEKIKKKSDHISKGMDITRNRINLFKKIGKNNAAIYGPEEITKNGKPFGTRVKLILPLING
jgi:ligand-binding sensor domain-containing protein